MIAPCRNEREHVLAFCDAVAAQVLPPGVDLEVLVADGRSDDGTRDKLLRSAAEDARLRMIDNPGRIVSTGLNRCLAEARGAVIVRMDLHTEYDEDYIAECLAALERSGADNVGGPWCAEGDGGTSDAIAAAFQSRWVAGGARSRDLDHEGRVDTVYRVAKAAHGSALLFTFKHVADNRTRFLENFYLKSKRSVAKARTEGPAAYVIPGGTRRPLAAARLVNLLRKNGVEVHIAGADLAVGKDKYPAGSYVVRMDQPYSRCADMLLDTQYYNPKDPRPYDDTGWTFGPLHNVKTIRVADVKILDASMALLGKDVANEGRLIGKDKPAADALRAEVAVLGVTVVAIEPGRFATNIVSTSKKRMEEQGRSLENSPYAELTRQTLERYSSAQIKEGPERVARAIAEALSSPVPRPRNLVVSDRRDAEFAIRRELQKVAQLNQAHPFSYDRNTLVMLLDEALANPGGGATMSKVTGTVSYRERIALPPAATARVQLVDVSRADAPADVLGEQLIESAGRQAPFSFEIPYDPSRIDERMSYAVQARIEDGGRLLFISDQSYPVITLVTKVYFPRALIPISPCIVGLLDLAIASSILIGMMIYFQVSINLLILLFLAPVIMTFALAAGLSFWLSAVNVRYRDVVYLVPFFIQILLFASPILYASSIIPENLDWVLYLNPIAGIMSLQRGVYLGTPVDWVLVGCALVIITVVFIAGLFYFRQYEKDFADVI